MKFAGEQVDVEVTSLEANASQVITADVELDTACHKLTVSNRSPLALTVGDSCKIQIAQQNGDVLLTNCVSLSIAAGRDWFVYEFAYGTSSTGDKLAALGVSQLMRLAKWCEEFGEDNKAQKLHDYIKQRMQ